MPKQWIAIPAERRPGHDRGSPEEIVSEIGEYARLAPTEFSVSFTGGMTTHRWEVHTENDYQVYLQSIETFDREIIPTFRD